MACAVWMEIVGRQEFDIVRGMELLVRRAKNENASALLEN